MPQPRVRIILPLDNQYLMEELNNIKYPERIGMLRFPGGGVEIGELPKQAAVRELYEELGLRIKSEQLELLSVIPHHKWSFDEYYFVLRNHGLQPGIYIPIDPNIGDPEVTLVIAHPKDKRYFGAPEVINLLESLK